MPPDPFDDRREDRPDDHGDRDSDADAGTGRGRGSGPGANERDGDPADEHGDPADERLSAGGVLSSLLNALESLDRISGSGSRKRGNRRLEYDVSIGSGLGSIDPDADRSTRPSRSNPSTDRSTRRRRGRSTSSYRTEVQRDEGRMAIVADVAGTDPDDVTVGYDDDDVVVAIDGGEIERVEVPWTDPEARARVKNGVLTVTIERGGEARE